MIFTITRSEITNVFGATCDCTCITKEQDHPDEGDSYNLGLQANPTACLAACNKVAKDQNLILVHKVNGFSRCV